MAIYSFMYFSLLSGRRASYQHLTSSLWMCFAVVLPKSVHEEYIVENQDIFNFSLSDEDMASLNSLDCGHHFCWSAEDVI